MKILLKMFGISIFMKKSELFLHFCSFTIIIIIIVLHVSFVKFAYVLLLGNWFVIDVF